MAVAYVVLAVVVVVIAIVAAIFWYFGIRAGRVLIMEYTAAYQTRH